MSEDIKWWLFRIMVSPVCWLLVAVIIAISIVGKMEAQDLVKANSHYCKMVEQYIDSDGMYGWPDYDNRYENDCR